LKNSISQLDQAYELCRKETQKWAKTFYLGTFYCHQKKEKPYGLFMYGVEEQMK